MNEVSSPVMNHPRDPAWRPLRHKAVVRITHWIMVVSVVGLLVTGFCILISHPWLYWGEVGGVTAGTGGAGAASYVALPIPAVIGPSIWSRPSHFFFAWMLVFAGVAYVVGGIATGHLRENLLPSKADINWNGIVSVISAHLRWKPIGADEAWKYNVVQRLVYLALAFVWLPGIVWTALAMSPAITSVFPGIVDVLGGFQSARTLHFVFGSLIAIFIIVHLVLLCHVGFTTRVRAMITGYIHQEGSNQ
jgi:thiosulfate reductase cytochrome b subunit